MVLVGKLVINSHPNQSCDGLSWGLDGQYVKKASGADLNKANLRDLKAATGL